MSQYSVQRVSIEEMIIEYYLYLKQKWKFLKRWLKSTYNYFISSYWTFYTGRASNENFLATFIDFTKFYVSHKFEHKMIENFEILSLWFKKYLEATS